MENGQNVARRKSVGLLSSQIKLISGDTGSTSGEAYQHPAAKRLAPLEKRYLLAAEHGDVSTVRTILEKAKMVATISLDFNCMDPLGRTAVRMAIDNENLDMLETLLLLGVHPKDGLLHAINAEYVEAVEILIEYEERHHRDGKPYSWELMDIGLASFTPEITPLILAAHKDNYEILKLLLDRGASLPLVHDVKCGCRECKVATAKDCLKHSRTRISSYKALASPSLICLSSLDPILTAFELSYELRKLSCTENEFKQEYLALQKQCQKFATDLIDQVRNSHELETVLTYDGTHSKLKENKHSSLMNLPRIEMAIKYKQKTFIAHSSVQQLLMSLWYDGMSEFRRKNNIKQAQEILKIGILFPLYACLYMICPTSSFAKRIRKPFFKFIIHSFSYLFFLLLLILASQRVESILIELLGTEEMKKNLKEEMMKQRGQLPTITEFAIMIFVIAHAFQEIKEVWKNGFLEYFANMWNIIDNTRNTLYIVTIGLRLWAFVQETSETFLNPDSVFIPRESWDTFDPNLIADGCFAAGNIFAALKLVHMFSINQYLGPLQVSLGRMVIDIIKFFFIYSLVLFAFACGMNQLLWYYADLERQKCQSLPNGEADWDRHRDSCNVWRRFSNLFESSQTLFWASFGLIDIGNFDLTGIKDYTRFWGLLMFGSYSVINVVVLLNLLIAMMSNSYHIISVRSDVEWKFARTKLFLNYFEEGGTLPPPFNCLPNVKHLLKLCSKRKEEIKDDEKENHTAEIDTQYQIVMRNLVWRYITAKQHDLEHRAVTEDDISEMRQDINTFRFQMLDVFQSNGMEIGNIRPDKIETSGKKIKVRERRLLKDFSISMVEDATKKELSNQEALRSRFQELTRTSSTNSKVGSVQRSSLKWRELIFSSSGSPIGRAKNQHSLIKTDSLKKTLLKEISWQLENQLRRKSRSIECLTRSNPEKELAKEYKSVTTPTTPSETPALPSKYIPKEKYADGYDRNEHLRSDSSENEAGDTDQPTQDEPEILVPQFEELQSTSDPISDTPVDLRTPSTTSGVLTQPTNTSNDLIQPATTSEDFIQPTIAEDLMQPSTTEEDLMQPSTTEEDLMQPSTTEEDLMKPSNKADDLMHPSTAPEDLTQPSATAVDLIKPSTTSLDLRKPSTTSVDLRKPSATYVDLRKPSATSVDLRKPRGISGDLRRFSTTSAEVRAPLRPSVESRRKSTISTNLGKQATTTMGPDNLAFDIDEPIQLASASKKKAPPPPPPLDVKIDLPHSPVRDNFVAQMREHFEEIPNKKGDEAHYQIEKETSFGSSSLSPRRDLSPRSPNISESSSFSDHIALLPGRRSPKWF